MTQTTNNKCSAKNPAVCRNHGWVQRPVTGAEAYEALQNAQIKSQHAHGRESFLKAEQEVKKAKRVFYRTPEGQQKLKDRIALVKDSGGATVPLKAELAEAKYDRTIEEGNFHVEGVKQQVFATHMPAPSSSDGRKLVKELFKGSTQTPEQLTGKPLERTDWNELVEARKKEIADTATFRYRKSFVNRLTADLKETDLTKKKVAGKKNEYVIKNSEGVAVAKINVNNDGSLKDATVATSNDGRTHTYSDGNDFRKWVEMSNSKAIPIPEWV